MIIAKGVKGSRCVEERGGKADEGCKLLRAGVAFLSGLVSEEECFLDKV